MPKKKVSSEVSEYFSKIGKKGGSKGGKIGGKRSLETMTAQERSERAKKAAAKSATVRKKNAAARRKASDARPRDQPLPPSTSRRLVEKAATDPMWQNKTTGAKKV